MWRFPLSLRERAGVRKAARTGLGLVKPAPVRDRTALAASLTPTLSRRERGSVPTARFRLWNGGRRRHRLVSPSRGGQVERLWEAVPGVPALTDRQLREARATVERMPA